MRTFGRVWALAALCLGVALAAHPAAAASVQPGWYAGVNLGAAMSSWTRTGLYDSCCSPFTDTHGASGLIAGGQIGFNAMPAGSWMWGVEGDLNAVGNTITFMPGAILGQDPTSQAGFRTDWIGTLRARLGFDAGTVLFYGTGGVAVGGVQYNTNDNGFNVAAQNNTMVGWTAGFGAEMPLSERCSIAAEFLHVDLGTSTFDPGGLPDFVEAVHAVSDLVRVKANFHW